jgi:hypothetical protein
MTPKLQSFLLGLLIGDALALPANNRSHGFIRMYFKGIKGYTAEYHGTASATGLRAGQNSFANVLTLLKSVHTLENAVDVFFAEAEGHQPFLKNVFTFLATELFDKATFVESLTDKFNPSATLAEKLQLIEPNLDYFPIDLASLFNGQETVEDAIAFSLAMLVKSPNDFETAVLSAINHGGRTTLVGAITGGGVAMLVGRERIPEALVTGLENADEILKTLGEN